MTSGLAKIVDLVVEFWNLLVPWVVIDSFEEAIILRLGGGKLSSPSGHPYHRKLTPGLYFVIPFIDRALSDNIVPTTTDLEAQVYTTKDGRTVLCRAHVLWSIRDIVVFLLDVEDGESVLTDATAGTIRHTVHNMNWGVVHEEELEKILTTICNDRARKFGVKIHRVYLSELAPTGLKNGVLRV